MERDIFITKGGVLYGAGLTATYVTEALAAGGFWESTSATVGSLAVFNTDQSVIGYDTGSGAGALGDVIAADLTGTSIYIGAMGINGLQRSTEISRKSFSYSKRVYAAPVEAIKCLGANATAAHGSLNLPSAITVGDTVGVTILDNSKQFYDESRIINYSFAVVTGDLLTGVTAKNIIVKLVALINGNSNSIVTAVKLDDSSDADGIQFTADTAGSDFEIVLMDGVLKDADILQYKDLNGTYTVGLDNTVVANVVGEGTAAQALKAERDSSVRQGNTGASHTTKDNLYTPSSNVAAAGTYTVYSLYGSQVTDNPIQRSDNFEQLIQIFVPSAETNANEVATVLDELLPFVNP
jgi:hypothetical protein